MKCIDLIATQYVIMADCGGHVMNKGDMIMVDIAVADRMCLQHKLTKGESHEVEKLQHGHWQLRKMAVDAPVVSDPKQDVSDVPPAKDFEPQDKSMGTQDGKPKKKKKKTTSKK